MRKNTTSHGRKLFAVALAVVMVFGVFAGIGTTKQASAEGEDYFDKDLAYYIWLKDGGSLTWRANMDDTGKFKNNAIHLDDVNGNNCSFEIAPLGDGYFSIRYTNSDMYIDVEGNDNGKENQKLHQYHDSIKADNQKFKFIPVEGEQDTYKIQVKSSGSFVGVHDNNIKKKSDLCTARDDKITAQKWYIVPINEENKTIPGSKAHVSSPSDGAPTFALYPEGKIRPVDVNNDAIAIGNCLQTEQLGRMFKVTAEWIPAQGAYKLRNYLNLNTVTTNHATDFLDYVWDVDGGGSDENAVIHIWSNKGDGKKSQLWRFINQGNDTWQIKNLNSGKYLALQENVDDDEVKLVQKSGPENWKMYMLDNTEGVHTYDDNKTESDVNAGNWMSKLSDDIPLSAVNIPGTHDACCNRIDGSLTYNLLNQQWIQVMTQYLYLGEQLNAGVRAWDIRVSKFQSDVGVDDPEIVHGNTGAVCYDQNYNPIHLSTVMNTARDFLSTHKKETIVITLKGDALYKTDDDDVAKCVLGYIKDSNYPIYKFENGTNQVPKLSDVRGKIVFVSRLAISTKVSGDPAYADYMNAFGPDASRWDADSWDGDNYKGINGKGPAKIGTSIVYAQDYYKSNDPAEKMSYFDGTVEYANSQSLTDSNILFNYTAANDRIELSRDVDLSLLKGEAYLNQVDSASSFNRLGFVMTNHIDPALSRKIYLTNFDSKGNALLGTSKKSQTTEYEESVQFAQSRKLSGVSVKAGKKGTAKVSWKKLSGINGVQILWTKDKKFRKKVKKIEVEKKGAIRAKIKGLDPGITFYFKARAYTYVKNPDTGKDEKVLGKFTKVLKYTTK